MTAPSPEASLATREMTEADIASISRYWLASDPAHMEAMGVDLAKLPSAAELEGGLRAQLALPIAERRAFCIIWLVDGAPVGHCNTNPTVFGEDAFMHLHVWHAAHRRRGLGTPLLRMTLPWFFDKLALKCLYSEPYAKNPAPHRALERAGFLLEREYTTVPGSVGFEQSVKRWRMTRETFEATRA